MVALACWTTPRSFILPARRLPTDASIGPFTRGTKPWRGGAIRSAQVHRGDTRTAPGPRELAPQSAQADRTWMARSPFGPVWTSKLTASPPLRRSKSRESVRPSLWKKLSLPVRSGDEAEAAFRDDAFDGACSHVGNLVSPRTTDVRRGAGSRRNERPGEGHRGDGGPPAYTTVLRRPATAPWAAQLPRLAVITGCEVGAFTRWDSAVTAKTTNPEIPRSRGTTATASDGVRVPTATGLLSEPMSHSS